MADTVFAALAIVYFVAHAENQSRNNMAQTSLKCPKCGNALKSDVLDSRSPLTGDYIRRRRVCQCGHKFTTREVVWSDNPQDPCTLKTADVLNLRVLALDIIRRTDPLIPSAPLEGSVRPADSSRR